MYIISINDYIHVVPFVENENEIFLKTIIPSRKQTKKYIKNESKEKFRQLRNRNSWCTKLSSSKTSIDEIKSAKLAAQNTIEKFEEIKIEILARGLHILKTKT